MSKLKWSVLASILISMTLSSQAVLAHDGEPHAVANWWEVWSLEPAVLLLLGATLVVYRGGYRAMNRRAGNSSASLKKRTRAFVIGMTTLGIALLSPLDGLAGQLFWVHMVQHSLLMLVTAPLLVVSLPLAPILLGLPEGTRRWIGQGWKSSNWLRRMWGLVSAPLAAWLLHAMLVWVWHAPALYQASVENSWVHALQHFSFLGSALLFWWVALHTLGKRPALRGVGILYLFTTALHSGLLGALFTFSPRVLYPVYAGQAERWGISALADQQLAGTLMWVVGGLVYLAAALWLMKVWIEGMESKDEVVL